MTTARTLIASFFLLLLVSALGSVQAQSVTDVRDVDAFTRLHMKSVGDVTLTQGDERRVEIIAPNQEIIDKIRTQVRGDRLVIETDVDNDSRGFMDWLFGGDDTFDGDDLEFRITMTDIREIRIDGTGDIEGTTPIEADQLDIRISGTGDADFDLNVNTLTTRISGTGDAELQGIARSHDISVSGTGDVEAGDLETEQVKVRASGTGDCTVYVTGTLDASVSGLGDIRFRGNPSEVSTSASGLGSIEPYDD